MAPDGSPLQCALLLIVGCDRHNCGITVANGEPEAQASCFGGAFSSVESKNCGNLTRPWLARTQSPSAVPKGDLLLKFNLT